VKKLVGRRARVATGRTAEAGPAHPAEGSSDSCRAKTSTSTGASQYSGIAMNAWVTVVISRSATPPCRSAARTPSTSAAATAVPRVSTTRLSVIARAGSTCSSTGVRLA